MAQVDAECSSCGGSGLYRGMAEKPGTAVVCLRCDGSGKQVIRYEPFVSRKEIRGVDLVYRSSGSLIVGRVGAYGNPISYREFLQGKMP